MKISRRQLLAAGAAFAAAPSGLLAEPAAITPERFGAVGDGRTNDSAAFAAMAAFVNARGGGEIFLRRATYVVGINSEFGDVVTRPPAIMHFFGCRGSLVIRGNGARLLCQPGLLYGAFDPASRRALRRAMPNYRKAGVRSPYRSMIRVERCSGPVEISDLELDGNIGSLVIGGQYGDVGWQIPASGIELTENSGSERLSAVRSHHHPLDGLIIDGRAGRNGSGTISKLECEHNGRQGCSIVGGSNYAFLDCSFAHTGKAGLASPPGAGVDIEAEGGKQIRNLSFVRCAFSDNSGPGLVAESGPSEGVQFDNCWFIGTTSWSAWPNKPGFRFSQCQFVGAMAHAFGDPDPARACQFVGCEFRDDPALSPTGRVYGGENASRPIADLPANRNAQFDRCTFRLTHDCVLPWSTRLIRYRDCTMSQRAAAQSYPRGTYLGTNRIDGNAILEGSLILGEVILNGRRIPRAN